MSMMVKPVWILVALIAVPLPGRAGEGERLEGEFQQVVRPFLSTYCADCHGREEPEAKFDVSPYVSLQSVTGDLGHWELILNRVRRGEMPPEEAGKRPEDELRQRVVGWIERLRRHEAARNAGDPGTVLARRLSNAEYDYSIQDLTGVDIRSTREFPVDPANEAGFDNSGETLAMSPALLNKYLAAARQVADHLLFLPEGLGFAPHPVVIYSDRDKFAVHRIVDFYQRQPVDLAAYFRAAWRYRFRVELGTPEVGLEQIAGEEQLSGKYLQTLWTLLTDAEDHAGPIADLRQSWQLMPRPLSSGGSIPASVRTACEHLREGVLATRNALQPPLGDFDVPQLNKSSQPVILWKNRELAAQRQRGALPAADGGEDTEQLRAAIARFCHVFPDKFYVSERGRMFLDPKEQEKGRFLSAGFHLMVGYFRDDRPLYDLILERDQQQELDRLWRELDFITQAPIRQFSDFIYFERAEYPGLLKSPEFDFARENADMTAPAKLSQFASLYLAKARSVGIAEPILEVIEVYFRDMSASIRGLEETAAEAEPKHLDALLAFAARAWRRPLGEAERQELAGFYQALRERDELSHEEAIRDTLVMVLMSPRFSYRITTTAAGPQVRPLASLELASRLSYFLWSSLPDEELARLAAEDALRDNEVLRAQTRRMLQDERSRRLATEFGGNWLDFRRFESHQGVNRERFPEFTSELRQAMYEEPIRFLTDLLQRDGSVEELLQARHTFVNPVLAEHYGIPFVDLGPQEWVRVDDAARYGRGGLLPMAAFLTQNSPGLRTSPVKRGYWVVRRLLGEQIPPPPPAVPELPEDEAELGELSLREVLARHREVKSCAACHARFDGIGLVFEGYGPIGERRAVDLGDRPVETAAVFPDGSKGDGLPGLHRYLQESRRSEFIDNLCRKLLSYALSRSLQLSDELTIEQMKEQLAAHNYRVSSLIETIVTSPQFLHRRSEP